MNYFLMPGAVKTITPKPISHKDIFIKVCDVFKQQPEDVLQKCRKRDYAIVRQVSMTLFRMKTRLSLTQIGDFFSKDHATVLHSIKTVNNLRETDRQFREQTDPLFIEAKWPYIN